MTHTASPSDGQERWRVVLRDLEVPGRIGVHDIERAAEQRVLVNLEITFTPTKPIDDDIANVMDYDELVQEIRALIGGSRVYLLETFADQIADFALSRPCVDEVRVRVDKPDIYRDVGNVGIELVRRRV